jgi:hypothetical protein
VDEGGCSCTEDPGAREDKDVGDCAQTQTERWSDVSEGASVGRDVRRRSRKQKRVRSGLVTLVPDEHSSESCEIGGLVQERVERLGKVDIVELQDGGTWYYVVDCATCNALIPFKYAPEDEPVLCFPTMTVRCFHCHAAHTYAPGLISHRKAVPPREIPQRDRPSCVGDDGDQEASGDRQEVCAAGGSERDMIVEREICLSSSSQRAIILIAAVSGKTATIFFWSSCSFAVGWVLQLALHIFYAARSSGPAVLLTTGYFGS